MLDNSSFSVASKKAYKIDDIPNSSMGNAYIKWNQAGKNMNVNIRLDMKLIYQHFQMLDSRCISNTSSTR